MTDLERKLADALQVAVDELTPLNERWKQWHLTFGDPSDGMETMIYVQHLQRAATAHKQAQDVLDECFNRQQGRNT